MDKSKNRIQLGIIVFSALIAFGFIYYVSTLNYLFPHTFMELTGAVVSMSTYSIGWNTRKYSKNNFMTVLAMGFLFSGIMTIFHVLTYQGMGVLPGIGTNIAIQFWISARGIEGITLLLAVICLKKNCDIPVNVFMGFYLILCIILTFTIYTGVFPNCYIEEKGLTTFKIISEYIISGFFLISGYNLWKLRKNFETDIFQLILTSIVFTILSEVSFTLYTDPYGFMNLLGHYFMIISVLLIYISLVKGNLTRPYNSLFKNVSDYAEKLVQKNKELDIKDRAIASSLNAFVFIDIRGRITYVNQAFLKIMGYKEEEVLGRSLLDYLEKSDHLNKAKEKLKADGRWYGEIILINKDGSFFPAILTCNFIYSGQGELICGVASFRDITEHKMIESELTRAKNDAEAANRAKSFFLANMSHEIRTPVNGILGFLQLLEKSAITGKQLEYINYIKTSASSLLTLINDILDVSKIEAGKLELEIISFDLYSAIENTFTAYAAFAGKKDLDLILQIGKTVPRYVIGDPTRLKQVISNLLGNAVKYTQSGHILLGVDLKLIENSYSMIEFIVEDTGIGISQKVISKLFQPFTQADASSNRKFGGTGLGLSLCKSFVTMMGGEIRVESTEGKGSKFIFTLSFKEDINRKREIASDTLQNQKEEFIHGIFRDTIAMCSENEKKEAGMDGIFTADGEELEGKVRPLKVLLAEDNEINRLFFLEFLKMKGIDCDIAIDGEEAVNACLFNNYDYVFMDCQMPKMDGYEAAKRIREAEGKTKHTVIIAITANAMKCDAEKCLASGMDDFISKPVDSRQIIAIIKRYESHLNKT